MSLGLLKLHKQWIEDEWAKEAKRDLLAGRHLGDNGEYSFSDIWTNTWQELEHEIRALCESKDKDEILALVMQIKETLSERTDDLISEYINEYTR